MHPCIALCSGCQLATSRSTALHCQKLPSATTFISIVAVLLSLDLFVFPSAFMLLLKRLMTAVPAVQGPVASAITTALNNSLQPSHLEGCTPPR